MKTINENSSDKELLHAIYKLLKIVVERMPEPGKPTLKDIGFVDNDNMMDMLKIKRGTANKLRTSGQLRFSRIGQLIFYKLSDIIDMLNKHFERH